MGFGSAATPRPSTGPGAGDYQPLTPNKRKPAAIGGGAGCAPGQTEVASEGGVYGTCPPGSSKSPHNAEICCQGGAAAGGGLPGLGNLTGSGAGGGAGGGNWKPGKVERPEMKPIQPKAEYDPKIAEALARQTQYGTMLEEGAGHSMDVLTAGQADQLEAQVAQARAAAAQAGIPFDEASFRSTAMRGINASMAQEKAAREQMLGQAYAQQAQTATAEGGERNQRLGIDLSAQQATMQDLLQRYGQDIQKYGIDAQAATSANNALLGFYSQLMGGMFDMFGQMGSMNMQNQNYYG